MTARNNFRKVLNFEQPEGRLPMIEWAAWWDRTVNRWENEGLPADFSNEQLQRYFGLDPVLSFGSGGRAPDCPREPSFGAGILAGGKTYESIRPYLFGDAIIRDMVRRAEEIAIHQTEKDIIVYFWVEGYFWFPRVLLGIMDHLYAFYDQQVLLHRINADLSDFHVRLVEAVFAVLTPDIMVLAEDMSYNKGPMISSGLFREFLLPYYRKVIPCMKKTGLKVFIDSDGDVTPMIPWLIEAGFDGALPLEKQAGVDMRKIRQEFPLFLMLGGFDKMVLSKGAEDVRREFERLLPVMRSGGYIPSVDHQTPPEVSLEQYLTYIRLFRQYASRGVGL